MQNQKLITCVENILMSYDFESLENLLEEEKTQDEFLEELNLNQKILDNTTE